MTAREAAMAALARFGSATVYEAGGRQGFIDADFRQIIAGSRVAGPARTVRCAQGDNLMVHIAMPHIDPGDVLVITMTKSEPIALVGEMLATQAVARGAAGILVDGAVRDTDELVEIGLPIWARWIHLRGPTRTGLGELDVPVSIGGQAIHPNDVLVLNTDGIAVIASGDVDAVLAASTARAAQDTARRARLRDGELSCDIDGLAGSFPAPTTLR